MKKLSMLILFALIVAMLPLAATAKQPPMTAAGEAVRSPNRLPAPETPGTLWANGSYDDINGLASELNTAVSDARTADDFELDAGCPLYDVTQIRGTQMNSSNPWNAQVEVYADSGGIGPGALIGTFPMTSAALLGYSQFGWEMVEYTYNTPGLQLPPGHYWVSSIGLGDGSYADRSFFATSGNGVVQLQEGYFLSSYFGFYSWTPGTSVYGYYTDYAFDVDGACSGQQEPDIEVTPESLYAEQCPDTVTTQTLQVCNVGTADLTWSLTEQAAPKAGGKGALPEGVTSAKAPAGYVVQKAAPTGLTGGTVAVLKDANAWGSLSVENILSANAIPFEVHGSGEFGSLDFGAYGMIYVQCDQPSGFYDAYAAQGAKFEQYVQNGGFLAFCAADQGWNGGVFTAPLPGGMTYSFYGEANVWIDDLAHPTMAGVPNPFNGSWASHGIFANLPAGAHVIAHGEVSGAPVTVEYPLGAGWFIGLAETLEITYDYGWQGAPILPNLLLWGYSWGGAPDIPWLSEDPTSGTVQAGGCQDVTVTFDSTGLAVGDYFANLVIASNDPDEPTVTVPVQLRVLDCANNTIHVGFIHLRAVDRGYGKFTERAQVQILDFYGGFVPDAMVYVAWTLPDGQVVPQNNITRPIGEAAFKVKGFQQGVFQLCVTDVVKAGWVYDPNQNVETCDWLTVP